MVMHEFAGALVEQTRTSGLKASATWGAPDPGHAELRQAHHDLPARGGQTAPSPRPWPPARKLRWRARSSARSTDTPSCTRWER